MGFLCLQRRELAVILAAIAATGAVWADVPVVVETPYTVTETQPSTVQAPAGAALVATIQSIKSSVAAKAAPAADQ